MSRPLRIVKPSHVAEIDATIGYLRKARAFAINTPALHKKIVSAIKSAEGAKRHALGVLARQHEAAQ